MNRYETLRFFKFMVKIAILPLDTYFWKRKITDSEKRENFFLNKHAPIIFIDSCRYPKHENINE